MLDFSLLERSASAVLNRFITADIQVLISPTYLPSRLISVILHPSVQSLLFSSDPLHSPSTSYPPFPWISSFPSSPTPALSSKLLLKFLRRFLLPTSSGVTSNFGPHRISKMGPQFPILPYMT